jgi:thiol-disulfide isomerase/thioredoxin
MIHSMLWLVASFALAGDDPRAALHPTMLDGSTIDVGGKVVVLNFWASWCAPCRAELPLLEQLHDRLDHDRALVVGVNVDASERTGQALARRLSLDLPVSWDPNGQVASQLSPPAMPTTYVIDAQGRVAETFVGELHAAEIDAIAARVASLTSR